MSDKRHLYGLTPAGIPLTLMVLGTILAVATNPTRRTVRLLHNLAGGIFRLVMT
jgi:hypothetical protein